MIKRILVPLDPSPYAENATRVACAIARQFDAEIEGLAVLDVTGIEKSVGPVPLGGTYYAEHLAMFREEEARERIQTVLKKFESICKAENVRRRHAERQGGPSGQILSESIFYDLVVIGARTYFQFETSEESGKTLDKILDRTVTPVLTVPRDITLPDLKKDTLHALIAFDGSLPSARALHVFAHLAVPEAMRVTVLMSDEDEEKAGRILEMARDFLRAHGVENAETAWTSEDIRDALLETYQDRADLLVVGAHTKRGLLDFVLGSLTEKLIQEADKPILIGQ